MFSCTPVQFPTQVGRQSENYVYVTAKTWIQLSAHLLDCTKLQQCVVVQFLHANFPPLSSGVSLNNGCTIITVAQLVKCKQVEKQTKNCQTCVVDEELPRWTSKTPQYWTCPHHDIFALGLTVTNKKCWFYIHIINFRFYWFFWHFTRSLMHDWQTYFIFINTVKCSLGPRMWNLNFQMYLVVIPCIWFMMCLLHFGKFVS